MRRLIPTVLLLAACSGSSIEAPDTYAFDGRTGEGSVAYSGQVFRNLLIDDMKAYIGGLTARIDDGTYTPAAGDVTADIDFYLAFDDSVAGELEHGFSSDPAPLQTTYADVSSGKDLLGKLAGNDEVGQHVDWSTGFVGWGEPGSTTPQGLVETWVAQLDAAAVARANGTIPSGPEGAPVPGAHVTAEGQDLQQLLEKFVRGAVAFSQGADDYLDDDTEGKGLLSDHTALVEGKGYTELEHQWDEGFGYFGAPRTQPAWTLDQIADDRAVDSDGDGAIDLNAEVAWGHATNAAKRDRGASASPDFVGQAWEGFAAGRALLDATDGALTDDELAELQGYRDQAVEAWEGALASTVVHYINDVLQDMGKAGTSEYSFADHAKHWSEAKGFALSLQFNPRSPLSDSDLARLHELLGDAPVLTDASAEDQEAYAAGLLEARALLGEAYGFDPENLGDDDGTNGW